MITTQKKLLEQCKINVKNTFGMVPTSVLFLDKNKELDELIGDKYCEIRNLGNIGKAKRRGGGRASKLNYSLFNTGLCNLLIPYFFRKGDSILDPFMGKATRPIITLLHDMNYTGYEVDPDTIKYVKKRIKSIKKLNDKPITIKEADGVRMKDLSKEKDIFDGIFTCPPYWNVEKYSGKGNDISHCKNFDNFLSEIQILMNNCYRLLKPSDYKNNNFHLAIFVVGSIRDGKKGLYDLDFEFQKLAKNAGFILHEKIIHQNKPTNVGITVRMNYMKRFTAKAHETILIFRKGG